MSCQPGDAMRCNTDEHGVRRRFARRRVGRTTEGRNGRKNPKTQIVQNHKTQIARSKSTETPDHFHPQTTDRSNPAKNLEHGRRRTLFVVILPSLSFFDASSSTSDAASSSTSRTSTIPNKRERKMSAEDPGTGKIESNTERRERKERRRTSRCIVRARTRARARLHFIIVITRVVAVDGFKYAC